MVRFLAGLGLAIVAVGASTVMDGNSFGPLIGPSSLVMVLLGAIAGGLFAAGSAADLPRLAKIFPLALTGEAPDPGITIDRILAVAELSRSEGALALEPYVEALKEDGDPVLAQGLVVLVDGGTQKQLEEAFGTMSQGLDTRHAFGIKSLTAMAAYSPAMGMLGTLIGLINMLGNLSDPDALGAGMAGALLTTLYGVFFGNLVFKPLAGGLVALHDAELAQVELVKLGVVTIMEGTSPRLLCEQLELLQAAEDREGSTDRMARLKETSPLPSPSLAAAA